MKKKRLYSRQMGFLPTDDSRATLYLEFGTHFIQGYGTGNDVLFPNRLKLRVD
jgi:hypothetical protein